jgi:YidC/Oxa1 family membrane protein insertase
MLSLFDDAVGAAYQFVFALAHLLGPMPLGLATAAAIVLFTIAVRLLLAPLSYYAIRGQASQARLAPQVQALRQRHAGQPDRLQRELTALYQREGTGMFAGCLPALLQLPFFSVMYRIFRSAAIGGHANVLLSHDLLSAPLGSHWLGGPGPFSTQGAVFLGLFALLAVVGWLAARVSRTSAAALLKTSASVPAQPGRPGKAAPPASATGAPGASVGWLVRVLPFATVAIAAVMPLAAGLYLLTTTAWAAAERMIITRRMPGRQRMSRRLQPDRGPQAALVEGKERRERLRSGVARHQFLDRAR